MRGKTQNAKKRHDADAKHQTSQGKSCYVVLAVWAAKENKIKWDSSVYKMKMGPGPSAKLQLPIKKVNNSRSALLRNLLQNLNCPAAAVAAMQ